MNLEEFKEELSREPNKISCIIKNKNSMEFTLKELIEIIKKEFDDAEKFEFLSTFKKVRTSDKSAIVESIASDEVQLKYIKDDKSTEGLQNYDFQSIINSMNDSAKMELLQNKDFFDQKKIEKYQIRDIISHMSDKNKLQFLLNKELSNQYDFSSFDNAQILQTASDSFKEQLLTNKELLLSIINEYDAESIIAQLSDDDKKIDFSKEYNCTKGILCNLSNSDKKTETILSGKYDIKNYDIELILRTYDIPKLLDFFQTNSKFVEENNLKLYRTVAFLSREKQLEFVSHIDDTNIDLVDKQKALIVLNEEVKAQIDKTHMLPEYITALEMPYDERNHSININIESDLSQYRNFDELITIKPQNIPFDKHPRLLELAKICPNLKVNDNIGLVSSTTEEFINGEKWIADVLSNIDENWTDIQKMAYIDHAVGKKVSYTPDFDTEICDQESARALWRIIDSEYGVCNGISQLEQYLLNHIGIESELVDSGRHTFLKVKNVEIPREDGSTAKGNTVIDPTWNLTANRYNGYPNLFARSYEEIRKFDITTDGTDKRSHKNDKAFSDGTIDIEESILRKTFFSIGLAKENGNFQISDLFDKCDAVLAKNIPLEQKFEQQLQLLEAENPDFDKCQYSTISVLQNILERPEINVDKLVIHRIFNKNDEKQTPSVFVYYKKDSEEKFFVAEPGNGKFNKLEKDNFIMNYDCYQSDLFETNGIRPWENDYIEAEQDPNKSSGKISAENAKSTIEGDER